MPSFDRGAGAHALLDEWVLVFEGFDPEQEGLREALCTLGNGYFATRGACSEFQAGAHHYPGTYLAGCYNRLKTRLADREVENEAFVNAPNWLPLGFRFADGDWLDWRAVEILSYRMELDLSSGVVHRIFRIRDDEGRETTIQSRWLVHIGRPHLAALRTVLSAENWSGTARVRSAVDGQVRNAGVDRYRRLENRHLEPVDASVVDRETIALTVRTNQSGVSIATTARTRVARNGRAFDVEREIDRREAYIAQEFSVDLKPRQPVTIDKVIAIYTSRDPAISECRLASRVELGGAGGFADLERTHATEWTYLWQRFDIGLIGAQPELGEDAGRKLRLHIFHLLQTVSRHSMGLDVGVPARGLHGEAYRGHVFWDELFVFRFLNLRMPEITRALLLYRYRRLDEARRAARAAGFRGAMYPWQSGSSGREESQKLHLNPISGRWGPDNTHLQRHVGAAVAYSVWQYYEATADKTFLYFYGAEMLLEIARFWASIATYNGELDRYEIPGIMGPDEYHDEYLDAPGPGIDNNAYTNVMAVWVLWRALDLLALLPADRASEIRKRLDLQYEEIERWEEITRKMRVVFHDDGIISQFEGYETLADLDWEGYRKKYRDIKRLDRILEAEGDTANRYKASKQADLLMLFFLFSAEELAALFKRLGYPFDYETIPRNIEYYLARTSHGSTLSRVVHAWVLARSDRSRSWQLLNEALASDFEDLDGTTHEGVHLGAMAGTVDIVQRCYTGIETREDILWLNPLLPDELWELQVRVHYRHQLLDVNVSRDRLKVSTLRYDGEPIRIGFKDEVHELGTHESKEFAFQ